MTQTMRLMILIATAALLAGGCRKTEISTSSAGFLPGRWDMVLVTGGIAGIRMTAEEYGQHQTYQFHNNGRCVITTNGNTTRTTYSTNVVADANTGQAVNYLLLANTSNRYTYSFAHDTLLLDMGSMVDGITGWYVRR